MISLYDGQDNRKDTRSDIPDRNSDRNSNIVNMFTFGNKGSVGVSGTRMILMKCSREKKVAATEKGCKKGRVDIVRGRTMGRNMLTDSRTHGCIGITEHKKRELKI